MTIAKERQGKAISAIRHQAAKVDDRFLLSFITNYWCAVHDKMMIRRFNETIRWESNKIYILFDTQDTQINVIKI